MSSVPLDVLVLSSKQVLGPWRSGLRQLRFMRRPLGKKTMKAITNIDAIINLYRLALTNKGGLTQDEADLVLTRAMNALRRKDSTSIVINDLEGEVQKAYLAFGHKKFWE
jgi:hypothetical protein